MQTQYLEKLLFQSTFINFIYNIDELNKARNELMEIVVSHKSESNKHFIEDEPFKETDFLLEDLRYHSTNQ